MENLKVSYTAYPSGTIQPYTNGMPRKKWRLINTIGFNTWQQYVYSFSKPVNVVREGGVCYVDGQESALRLAKEILG